MARAERPWFALAGVLIIAGLQIHWFLQPVASSLRVLAFLFVALSLWRPAAGLLVFAGLAPLSASIANLCGAPGMGGQLLEMIALGVVASSLLRDRAPEGSTRIGSPMLFMASVALASAAVMMLAGVAPFARGLSDGLQLAFRDDSQFSAMRAPLFAALVIAECGLLAWAVERMVRRSPQLAMQLVAMGLIGHAGAAVLNLQAMVGGALRTGDVLHALPQSLMMMRVSLQTDWNAGASALVLAGVAGLGLIKAQRNRRAGIALMLLLVVGGLWVTGSRIALAMAVGAALALVDWSAVIAGRRRVMVAGAVLLCLGVGAAVVASGLSGRNTPLPRSMELRWVMAKAGVEMFKEAPVFGIGINNFYAASAAFAGPYLVSVGWRPQENAHNNFIQVLAEQGLAGLGALLWVLATLLVSSVRAQISTPSALRGGLILAVVACVGTWLTGHPLLVPEFAFVFWFYCGVLAAMTPALTPARSRWPAWMLVTAVLLSIPPRAIASRDAANLEHQGIGVSLWQHDDSQRYREAGASFTLFVPAGDRPIEVPIRRAPGAPDPLIVDVKLRGRLIDHVSIGGDAWQPIVVMVPKNARLFEAVDFAVRPAVAGVDVHGVLLRVGKTRER